MRARQSRLTTTKRLKNAICHSQSFVNYISDDSKTKGLLWARKLVSGKYSNKENSIYIPNCYKYSCLILERLFSAHNAGDDSD